MTTTEKKGIKEEVEAIREKLRSIERAFCEYGIRVITIDELIARGNEPQELNVILHLVNGDKIHFLSKTLYNYMNHEDLLSMFPQEIYCDEDDCIKVVTCSEEKYREVSIPLSSILYIETRTANIDWKKVKQKMENGTHPKTVKE